MNKTDKIIRAYKEAGYKINKGGNKMRKSKGRFIYENLNPKNLKSAADCVVRAIAKGIDSDWETVYQSLSLLGLKMKDMPNSDRVYRKYLEQRGYAKERQPRKSNNTKYTLEEFVEKNSKGRFIVSLANHLTVVIDGKVYDTWNCLHKTVGNYWEVK